MHKNREISFRRGRDFISKSFTLIAFLLITQHMLGQTSDNFSDGDFTINLVWSGSTSHFIVNTSQQLQLNNTVAATSYLSAPFVASNLNELNWEFYIKQSFASSASNFGRVYLASDQAVLTGSLNGYYLQFGEAGTLDAIELFRQTGTTSTSVCRATNGNIANSFSVRVKVSRDNTGLWKLYVDYTGGTNLVLEKSATDVTHTTSSFFGVLCTYTLTNVNKFFFDDFSITPFVIPDTNPPTIQTVTVKSSSQLAVLFSEDLDEVSAETMSNYSVSDGIGNPASATLESDKKTVTLSFAQNFPNGIQRTIDVSGVKDLAGNTMVTAQKTFMFFQAVAANMNDIIITELFADPAPTVGLPEVEFVEIFNRSSNPFDLNGWKITDGTSTGTLSSLILLPNEYLILTPYSTSAQYNSHGKVMGLSTFPSLNNSGDAIVLRDATGLKVDSLKYTSTWYLDDEKKDGGWTLERIDPEDFCKESENWIASSAAGGGTPGKQNSVYSITPDNIGPKLISCVAIDPQTIHLAFDEKLSSTIPAAPHFTIEPAISINGISFTDATLKTLQLTLNAAIDISTVYKISASNIFDCPGNPLQSAFNTISLKLDNTAPTVVNIELLSDKTLKISFSEKLQEAIATDVSNYLITDDNALPASVSKISETVYHLEFGNTFTNGVRKTIKITGLKDLSENLMADYTSSFMYFVSRPSAHKDIIITEIFADPAPVVGLPEAEFIEIYNRSHDPFDLNGWKITDGTSTGNLPSKIILPGEYLVLTHTSSLAKFSSNALGLSTFPSLNNSGDAIVLRDVSGLKIDSVKYTLSWYQDDEKKDGGWSLERIDPEDLCKESENWIASNDTSGGTPGRQNSVYASIPDNTGPKLISCVAVDVQTIQLAFDEKLSSAIPAVSDFTIEPAISINGISFTDATLKTLQLTLNAAIDASAVYRISASNIFDCPGNPLQSASNSSSLKLDTTAPTILNLELLSDKTLRVSFSEKLQEATATDVSNYLITDGDISPISVSMISETEYSLEFANAFANGVRRNIKITGLKDLAENVMTDYTSSFMYFVSRPSAHKDVIITEIFADPAPVIGLPEAEFVEIYNRSTDPFDLSGWKITDGTSVGNLPSKIILPGEYLVLTHTSSVAKFSSNVLGLSAFPSLNNSGDAIVIKDATGLKIDSVKYSSAWYRDEDKRDGGWSLELIDPEDFCADSEIWIASNDPLGGTPGKQNSVYQITPDNLGPRLLNYKMNTPKSIELEFDEKLAIAIPSASSFSLEPAIEIESTDFMDASLRKIQLNLSQEIDITTTYTLTVTDVYDCPGNMIQPGFSRISIKLDNILPSVVSVYVQSSTELKILFSETVDEASVTANACMIGAENPSAISRLDESTYVLTFSPFTNGVKNQLTVKGVKDLADNVMTESHHEFLYFNEHAANFKDIIITEIFADPSPVVGLPEAEFIEIFNRSQNPFNLSGWTISDGGTPSPLVSKIILPNEYVIITANSSYTKFSSYGSIVSSTTFPSLNNSGDALVLRDRTGLLIDSLRYDLTWYKDDEKNDGGWTLELIYTENTCAEKENWIASESETGGTPGEQNSVVAEKPDLTGPMLISAIAVDPLHLKLQFNEKLEATTPPADKFLIQPSVSVNGVLFTDKALTTLDIELNEPLSGGVIYKVTANDLYDCPGNKIDPGHNSIEFALPEKADSLDIVINEILFNPRSTGVDFIEVYNKSDKYINLKDWALGNVDEDNVVNRKIISHSDFLLAPNSYLVFTEEANVLKGEYVNGIESRFFQMDIPSMSDDEGSVVLITPEEKIIDLVVYADHYHSVFLQDDEGVSLERLSFTESSMSSENWKSASSTVLATPGYRNSNYSEGIFLSDEQVSVQPEVFSPMGGQQDFTTINYKFDKTGYVAGVKIIDPLGREIKQIADNELLGPEGFFRWDGDQNNGSKARLGSYMVYFEVFDEKGVVKTFRKRVVIGAKF